MNTHVTAALLLCSSALSLAQVPMPPVKVSELQIGYSRETFSMHDLQASPMIYVANLNGIQLGYSRLTTRHQWQVGIRAGMGNLIAPSLGIRSIKFTPEQEQPLWLAPTLYRGELSLDYRRRIGQSWNRSSWIGIGLQDQIGYADGLALSTWAFHSAALRLQYQLRFHVGQRHTLIVDAALPVLAAVSRMPYSHVVSKPNRSKAAAFFYGTRLVTLNRFMNPELGLRYRFGLSRRVAFEVGYEYSWLRYPEPQLICTATHAGKASLIYTFQQH